MTEQNVSKDLLIKLEALNRVYEIATLLTEGYFPGKLSVNMEKVMQFIDEMQASIIAEAKKHPDAALVPGLLQAEATKAEESTQH